MLKVLIKKQLAEVFSSYFYDAKKNRMRSKGAVVAYFIFFVLIMAGLLGGIFTFLSVSLCGGMTQAGMGWLYFLLMGGIAILLGAFGSVFNTYSSLYLSKDNDLLLSMPIPVRTIMASRLMNVWLLGAMYAAAALLPAVIVYWVTVGLTFSRIICGILLFLIITVLVLLLSCLLGWVVAKISLRLKRKNIMTVLISLLFMAGYYFVYFRANTLIKSILANAESYGTKIKGAAYGLYLFGRIGEGDWLATLIFAAAAAALFALVWHILSRSFVSIATASGNTQKVQYVEKEAKEKSVFSALLGKEIGRFTSSANYMLNCGIGILFILACGVLLLIKGQEICAMAGQVFGGSRDVTAVLICAVLCVLGSMNYMAAPSVSLEGKSIWIPQSLPLESKMVLRAKAAAQLLLTGVPMLFAAICAAIVVPASPLAKILLFVLPLVFTGFLAVYDTTLGIRMPLLNWTNEAAPIKQSGAVAVSLFSSWGISIAFGGLYLLLEDLMGAGLYLLLWTVVFAVIAGLLLRWMDTKGAAVFAAL